MGEFLIWLYFLFTNTKIGNHVKGNVVLYWMGYRKAGNTNKRIINKA